MAHVRRKFMELYKMNGTIMRDTYTPACSFWNWKFFQFYFSTNQSTRPRHY